MNSRPATPPPDPSGPIHSDAIVAMPHNDGDIFLPKKTNCCDALSWVKPVLFVLTGCTITSTVALNVIYLDEADFSPAYTGIAAAISAITAAGLSKRLTIDSTQEIIDVVNHIREKESAPDEWPILTKNQEKAVRAIAALTGILSGVLNGYPIFFAGSKVLSEHYEFKDSDYLPLLQITATLVAAGTGLNIALSRSVPIYINLRNLLAKKVGFYNSPSFIFAFITGGLGLAFALTSTLSAQQFMIEASNAEGNRAAIYSIVALSSIPEIFGAYTADSVFAMQAQDEVFEYASKAYFNDAKFRWQKLAAVIISEGLAIVYNAGQWYLLKDALDAQAGYLEIDTPDMIRIGTTTLASISILFSTLYLDARTIYPVIYGTGRKISEAITWINGKCRKNAGPENDPLISASDDIERKTPNPSRFFSASYGATDISTSSIQDSAPPEIAKPKKSWGCSIL